ncbi:MAG: nuclear transport factor 2 family protein [Acidimicrobiaceae bacterium]|nr:nuclear transport factor 2 family protein [Acidimicrobiaceae bacterium]
MTDAIGDLLDLYYGVLTGGPDAFDDGRSLRRILAPDLDFEGPIAGRATGGERFIRGVFGFVETVRHLHLLQRLEAGSEAATLYDAEMPGGPVRFAEFFTVAEGRIQSLRLLYDATQYRARGGR